MDEPRTYLIFVCASAFVYNEEPGVLEIAAKLGGLDQCLVHTWVRTDHVDYIPLPRTQPVRRKLFYGQTAAFMFGQALEAMSGDVPPHWPAARVVVLVAPPDLFRDRVLSVINEIFVGTLWCIRTIDEFQELADTLCGADDP